MADCRSLSSTPIWPSFALFCCVLQISQIGTPRQAWLLGPRSDSPFSTHLLDLAQGLSSVRKSCEAGVVRRAVFPPPRRVLGRCCLLFSTRRWLGVVLDLMVAVVMAIVVRGRRELHDVLRRA